MSAEGDALAEVRRFGEELAARRRETDGPRWDAEVVAAAALAFNDAQTSGTLHPHTRTALDRMWTLQRPDGGWTWQADLPADDPRLQQGIAWLKSHQRASGRWFTRSLKKDGRHFITHAGTSFAVMAIASCDGVSEERAPQAE